MSTNTEVVLEVIRHFNTLDADGLRNLVTDNIKHTAAGTQFSTDLEGREEYLDYIRNLLSRFKKCDFQPYHVYDVDLPTPQMALPPVSSSSATRFAA